MNTLTSRQKKNISWQNTNSKRAITDFRPSSLNIVQFSSMQANPAPKETYLTINNNEMVIETNEVVVIMGYAEFDNLKIHGNG